MRLRKVITDSTSRLAGDQALATLQRRSPARNLSAHKFAATALGRFHRTTASDAVGRDLLESVRRASPSRSALGETLFLKPNADDPGEDLFHLLEGGKRYVFIPNDQYAQTVDAVCSAVERVKAESAGHVRLITWSSASGWLELYPEDGTPVARDNDKGQILPYSEKGLPERRTSYNEPALLDELFGKGGPTRNENDLLDATRALLAVGRFSIKPEDKKIDQTTNTPEPDRFVFLMNGMGPQLRFSASPQGNGRVLQAMREMAEQLRSPDHNTHVIFNDAPDTIPREVLRAVTGSTFPMPRPTKKRLGAELFRKIARDEIARQPKATEPVVAFDDQHLAAWRAVVGSNISEGLLVSAHQQGLKPDAIAQSLPEGKSFAKVVEQLIGFNLVQAQDLIGEAISRGRAKKPRAIDYDFIVERRFDMLKKDLAIELIPVNKSLPKPRGLDRMLEEIDLIRTIWSAEPGEDAPLQVEKLMFIAGPAGTGKSLTAKYLAQALDVPLYKVEFSRLFNMYVGNSEENVAQLFELLESLEPCAVWIDEIEKVFGGTAEGQVNHDSGVSAHIHGQVLTWFEEHKARVFVVGTCNDPDAMSSAILDRGIKFATGYPDPQALAEIWKENLDKLTRAHSLTLEDCSQLVELKPTLVGREVGRIIKRTRQFQYAERKKRGGTGTELITFDDVAALVRRTRSALEANPHKQLNVMRMSAHWESASGRPLYVPPLPAQETSAATPPSVRRAKRDEVL